MFGLMVCNNTQGVLWAHSQTGIFANVYVADFSEIGTAIDQKLASTFAALIDV